MLDDILETIVFLPKFKQIFNVYARRDLIVDCGLQIAGLPCLPQAGIGRDWII